MGSSHVPVLLEEVIEFLNPQPGGRYMDATLGLGGHAARIAQAIGAQGELLGFDRTAALTTKPAAEIADAAQRWGQEDDITVLTVRSVAA